MDTREAIVARMERWSAYRWNPPANPPRHVPTWDPNDWREALRLGAIATLEAFGREHSRWRTQADVHVWLSGPQGGSPVGLGGPLRLPNAGSKVGVVTKGTNLRYVRIDDGCDDPCGHINPTSMQLRVTEGTLEGTHVTLWAPQECDPRDAAILLAFEPLSTAG